MAPPHESLAIANKILQGHSSGRVRDRLESERARGQYTPRRPLFRLHFDADTFVSIRNSPAVSCSMTFQEYISEPCWKALHISPHLHDALGYYIDFNRSGADVLLTPLVLCLCRHYSQLYGRFYHPILRRGIPFFCQSGTSTPSLVFVLQYSCAYS